MQELSLTGIFFIPLTLGIIATTFFIMRFRLLRCYHTAATKSLIPLQKKDLPVFYSSYWLKNACRRRFFYLPPSRESLLAQRATENPERACRLLARLIRKQPHHTRLLLMYTDLCRLLNRRLEFQHTINQIKLPFFFPSALKADYLRLCALDSLYQTDMFSASSQYSRALKIYQKSGFTFEEAECYLSLAQTYRISGVFDVADTMLREASKIYKEMSLYAKQAETEAYHGLIEIGRENYPIADKYLNMAASICTQYQLEKTGMDIANWQGLTCFLQKKLTDAERFFALVLHHRMQASTAARAFAAEMAARINLQKKDFPVAIRLVDEAVIFHRNLHHRPGILENLYLKAEILYAAADYKHSTDVLTALIKEKTPASSIYYPANAYTLLGLIYLETGKLNQARTMFKNAIDMENSQNRLKGVAIDYNNLAELALREGNQEEALTYLNRAIQYAETLEDRDLVAYLKNKLEQSKN